MEDVRSALGDQVHHRSRCPAVFGRELVRDQSEFLNDFWVVQHLLSSSNSGVIGVLTVNHEVVATRTRTVHGEVRARCKDLVSAVELTDSRGPEGKSESVSETATRRRQGRKVG